MTYYKRGTVYLALGKARFALLDFDKVLELKPDFNAARIHRGNILLKQGEFDDASLEYHKVVRNIFTTFKNLLLQKFNCTRI